MVLAVQKESFAIEFLDGVWYFCMYNLKKVSFRVGVKPKTSSKIAVGCVFHSTSGLWRRLKKKKKTRKRNFVGSREGKVCISEHDISGVLVKSGDPHQFVPAWHPHRDCQRAGNNIVIEGFRLGRAFRVISTSPSAEAGVKQKMLPHS